MHPALVFPFERASQRASEPGGRSPPSFFVALIGILWERQRQKMGCARMRPPEGEHYSALGAQWHSLHGQRRTKVHFNRVWLCFFAFGVEESGYVFLGPEKG